MKTLTILLIVGLVCFVGGQRFETRSRGLSGRKLQVRRGPQQQSFRPQPRFDSPRPARTRISSPSQGTRPAPIDPTAILRSDPRPSKPSFDFQPKSDAPSLSAKGPRPIPLNLDKIFQIPTLEDVAAEEPEQPRQDLRQQAQPPITPRRDPSHFDDALRQVLDSRPPQSFDAPSFTFNPTQPEETHEEFVIKSTPPKPARRPPVYRPKFEEEPVDDFRPFVPASRPSRPASVVKVARPIRPAPPRQQPERPIDTPANLPTYRYPINPNQHITLVKEEKLTQKPIDFIDAKLRKQPVKVTQNFMHRNDDGTFTWGYAGEDGSYKEETRGEDCVVRGKYGYVDPSGVKREFTYETGNPCDPLTKLPLDAPGQTGPGGTGYYDYERGVYVTASGKEVPLQIQRQRKSRRL